LLYTRRASDFKLRLELVRAGVSRLYALFDSFTLLCFPVAQRHPVVGFLIIFLKSLAVPRDHYNKPLAGDGNSTEGSSSGSKDAQEDTNFNHWGVGAERASESSGARYEVVNDPQRIHESRG